MKRNYFIQLALGFDQLLNTILAGYADETLSSRAYRCNWKTRWHIAQTIIDTIFFWQTEHCFNAYLSEVQRKQLPPGFSRKIVE